MSDAPRLIRIFDTTLRDGEQSPGCSMDLEEKLEVARALERLRVDVIEAGFAASSPGDFQSVRAVADMVRDCEVASLSRALEADIDASWQALKTAQQPLVHIVLATSDIHMEHKLRMTPQAVLERVAASVKYARKLCPHVEFSAEDGMRSRPEFLAQAFQLAIENGATVVNLPDTVGYVTPQEMADMVAYLQNHVPDLGKAVLSVHCHDDLGMAVANSLSAVRAGAGQVECTINGLGERAGNAALEEVVMAIRTRGAYMQAQSRVDSTHLYRASRLVYNVIGMSPPRNKAVVGRNAFAHESGIHQHGVMANRGTYEIMKPEDIGRNTRRMVLGKHSGRHAFNERLNQLGYTFDPEDIEVFFEEFKLLADKKKEVGDDDIEAIVTRKAKARPGRFALERFDAHAGNLSSATCVVCLSDGGERYEEVALGDGPIDAAYIAIDKITRAKQHVLEDYSIRSVSSGKDALGEVVVKLRTKNRLVVGRGLSTDIIEASILAYVNAVNKIIEGGE